MRHINIRELRRTANLGEISQANKDIAQLVEPQRGKFIDDNGNKWSALKGELWRLGDLKCWYSEAKLQAQQGHVEHFRPKKKPHGLKGAKHEGYWWRAFDWENFRVAHPTSNIRVTDYLTGVKAGKGAYFPLKDGSPRASNKAEERLERPVLLDPCVKLDCRLLSFDTENGKPVPSFNEEDDAWKHQRAADTIDYYHLDEGTWNADRKDLIDEVARVCELLIEAESATKRDADMCDELIDELVEFIDKHQPFTAAAKQIICENGLIEFVA
jgi:hypothetical protein